MWIRHGESIRFLFPESSVMTDVVSSDAARAGM
jgi:hypothetical protein